MWQDVRDKAMMAQAEFTEPAPMLPWEYRIPPASGLTPAEHMRAKRAWARLEELKKKPW